MRKTAQDVIEIVEMPELEEIMATDEIPSGEHVIVEEPKKKDYAESQDLSTFMDWINGKMNSLPPHSGKTTAGCERVISHLKMLDKEISKAIARDTDCLLDDQAVEKFRKEIRKMVKKLEKRHKEINDAYDADDDKYASSENELVKEGLSENGMDKRAELYCKLCGHKIKDQKEGKVHAMTAHKGEAVTFSDYAPKTAGACGCSVEKTAEKVVGDTCPTCSIKLWAADDKYMECIACDKLYEKAIIKEANTPRVQLVMDAFQRAITGIIVNSVVANGKKAEDVYAELKNTYKFSSRDELSISQILIDLGYPIARNFIAMPHDNIEFATNYSA